MSLRLTKFIAPIALFLSPAPVLAQHHGGGHAGGHVGGYTAGGHHVGYGGGYHGGYSGYRGGYYGGYRGGYGYGLGSPFLGGYGLGYGGLGFGGLGYGGLGYGGLGYGGLGRLGYGGYGGYRGGYGGGYGYSVPYTSGYYAPTSDVWYSDPVPTYDPSVVTASGTAVSTTSATAGPAQVTFLVPEGAQVWFNGQEASGTGGSRVFTSATMQPGQSATLAVRARWDGSNREMQLPIQAGDKMTVDLR